MTVDITYRIVHRNQRSFLRLRFRNQDGESGVVMYGSTDEFIRKADAASLDGDILAVLHEDVNVLSQADCETHYRRDLKLSARDLNGLNVPPLGPPQEFALSFSKVDDTTAPAYRLMAKEWGITGRQSLEVEQEFSDSVLRERLSRVKMEVAQVRDERLPGSGNGRKLTEDEIELIFDPAKPEEIEDEELDLGL